MNLRCKPAIEINLLTGEQIWTNQILISYTYGEWICGIPTIKTNLEDLLKLPNRAVKLFGESPVHVVPPEFKDPELKKRHNSMDSILETPQLMPPFEIMAMFDCKSIGEEDWSSLIVCWHQYSVPPLVEEWILPTLQSIVWKDLAKDCYF